MGEKSSRITHGIKETRARLGWNLHELEHRVKHLSDWRLQFEQRPFTLMGLAAGGGALLAAVVSVRRPRHSRLRRAVKEFLRGDRSRRRPGI